jgi:trehalose-6-phosphate synthase
MGAGSLLISPLDIEGTAEALGWALDMSMSEREARLVRLRQQAEAWTAGHWLDAQLKALNIQGTHSEYSAGFELTVSNQTNPG